MTDTGWYRLGALTGIAALILFIVAFLGAGTPPAPDSTSLKIAQELHKHREGLLAATILFTLGSMLYFWFVSVVRSTLAEAEGGRGTLANTFFGSALASIIFAPLGLIPLAAGAFKLADVSGPRLAARADLIRVLYDFSNITTVVGNVLFAMGAIAAAIIILRTRVLAVWIGWLSLLLAALSILSVGGIAAESGPLAANGPVFLLGFLAFAVLTVSISISLVRRPVLAGAPATNAPVREPVASR